MNPLDISRINEVSPYVVSINKHGYFQFTTKAGVILTVGFDNDDLISTESYQFVIVNSNNKPSPRDTCVKDTVFAIISEFFRVNNATMLYICESGDGKQAMRSRLFSHWFADFANKCKYVFLQSSILDTEGIENYFAIITRTDNPHLDNVMAEFTSAVKLFRQKPEVGNEQV